MSFVVASFCTGDAPVRDRFRPGFRLRPGWSPVRCPALCHVFLKTERLDSRRWFQWMYLLETMRLEMESLPNMDIRKVRMDSTGVKEETGRMATVFTGRPPPDLL